MLGKTGGQSPMQSIEVSLTGIWRLHRILRTRHASQALGNNEAESGVCELILLYQIQVAVRPLVVPPIDYRLV